MKAQCPEAVCRFRVFSDSSRKARPHGSENHTACTGIEEPTSEIRDFPLRCRCHSWQSHGHTHFGSFDFSGFSRSALFWWRSFVVYGGGWIDKMCCQCYNQSTRFRVNEITPKACLELVGTQSRPMCSRGRKFESPHPKPEWFRGFFFMPDADPLARPFAHALIEKARQWI